MKGDTLFSCEINPKILEEFLKTFTAQGQREGDTIKAYIEKSMKRRAEEFKKERGK